MSKPQFFWGVLRHRPMLEVVLGRPVQIEPAFLADFAPYWAQHGDFAVLLPCPGWQAEGVLLRDFRQADAARLAFFERGFSFELNEMQVRTPDGALHDVEVYRARDPVAGRDEGGTLRPWDLADWAPRFAEEFEATFRDFMTHVGLKRSTTVAARYAQMRVRGASRVRARQAAPTSLRFCADAADVEVAEVRDPYARFFSVEEIDVSYRCFDGSMSPKVTRAGFVSGDAVTVLPYDPLRDRVLVVEQFRTGPHLRGDPQPWQIEPIAGRIDPGETPEAAGLREAVEEAGLRLQADRLVSVASYYPSPGILTEYLYSYVGLTDLPDDSAGVFGLEGEAEDIRGHLLDFDAFMALVSKGEVANAPLLITAYWLAANRERLRQEAAA